jgi:hypothetical protein
LLLEKWSLCVGLKATVAQSRPDMSNWNQVGFNFSNWRHEKDVKKEEKFKN